MFNQPTTTHTMKRRTEIQSKFFDIFSCLAILGGGKEERKYGGRKNKFMFYSYFPFSFPPFLLSPFLLYFFGFIGILMVFGFSAPISGSVVCGEVKKISSSTFWITLSFLTVNVVLVSVLAGAVLMIFNG